MYFLALRKLNLAPPLKTLQIAHFLSNHVSLANFHKQIIKFNRILSMVTTNKHCLLCWSFFPPVCTEYHSPKAGLWNGLETPFHLFITQVEVPCATSPWVELYEVCFPQTKAFCTQSTGSGKWDSWRPLFTMSLPTARFGKNFSLCQMDCKSFSQCANKSTKRGLTQFERLGLLEGTAHLTAYLPGQRWKGGSQMTPCWRERCAN